jgi:hypothetical protein
MNSVCIFNPFVSMNSNFFPFCFPWNSLEISMHVQIASTVNDTCGGKFVWGNYVLDNQRARACKLLDINHSLWESRWPLFIHNRDRLWNLHPSSEGLPNHSANESQGWYLVLTSNEGSWRLWVVNCNLTANQSIEILTRDGHDDLVPIVKYRWLWSTQKITKWCCITSGQIGLPGSLRRISPWQPGHYPIQKLSCSSLNH